MKSAGRTLLLAIIGALSAVVAFALSTPFANTLQHPGMAEDDPRFQFSVGTKWALVNHTSAGLLLCGGVAFVLVYGRKGLKSGLLSGLFGAALGAVLGAIADSGSDLLGIAIEQRSGVHPFIPIVIWCILVPLAYVIAITVSVGVTPMRVKRAIYALTWASIWSFVAYVGSGFLLLALVQAGILHIPVPMSSGETVPSDGGLSQMQASIPMWEATAAAIGFVLGAVFGRAESTVRAGSLMLVVGRNEGKEWNIDHTITRIGNAEGVEVPVRGFQNVAPVHAQVEMHKDGFLVKDLVGGTLLNGQPVQQAWLTNGDTIGVGQAILVFSSGRRQGAKVVAPMYQEPPPIAGPYPPAGMPAPAPYAPNLPPVPAALPMPRLVDAMGNTYLLKPGVNVIGREAGCEVSIPWDNSVSRRHAQVVLNGFEAVVSDLGSSNGTAVNGFALAMPAPLKPGDAVKLGNVPLHFLV
ncbi:MAG TPA: FHA domain-containing protein [Fimbriimonadaceae bacterium]|jgi:pSer/pThr/pTyr-binding forkhead associated (FHA) protein